MVRAGSFKITPEHIDNMVLKHQQLRASLGGFGVSPADHGRRDHERTQAKKDRDVLGPKPEKEPLMKKGYCLGCGKSQEFESEEVHHHANKTIQHKGKCPNCGRGMVSHFESKGAARAK